MNRGLFLFSVLFIVHLSSVRSQNALERCEINGIFIYQEFTVPKFIPTSLENLERLLQTDNDSSLLGIQTSNHVFLDSICRGNILNIGNQEIFWRTGSLNISCKEYSFLIDFGEKTRFSLYNGDLELDKSGKINGPVKWFSVCERYILLDHGPIVIWSARP